MNAEKGFRPRSYDEYVAALTAAESKKARLKARTKEVAIRARSSLGTLTLALILALGSGERTKAQDNSSDDSEGFDHKAHIPLVIKNIGLPYVTPETDNPTPTRVPPTATEVPPTVTPEPTNTPEAERAHIQPFAPIYRDTNGDGIPLPPDVEAENSVYAQLEGAVATAKILKEDGTPRAYVLEHPELGVIVVPQQYVEGVDPDSLPEYQGEFEEIHIDLVGKGESPLRPDGNIPYPQDEDGGGLSGFLAAAGKAFSHSTQDGNQYITDSDPIQVPQNVFLDPTNGSVVGQDRMVRMERTIDGIGASPILHTSGFTQSNATYEQRELSYGAVVQAYVESNGNILYGTYQRPSASEPGIASPAKPTGMRLNDGETLSVEFNENRTQAIIAISKDEEIQRKMSLNTRDLAFPDNGQFVSATSFDQDPSGRNPNIALHYPSRTVVGHDPGSIDHLGGSGVEAQEAGRRVGMKENSTLTDMLGPGIIISRPLPFDRGNPRDENLLIEQLGEDGIYDLSQTDLPYLGTTISDLLDPDAAWSEIARRKGNPTIATGIDFNRNVIEQGTKFQMRDHMREQMAFVDQDPHKRISLANIFDGQGNVQWNFLQAVGDGTQAIDELQKGLDGKPVHIIAPWQVTQDVEGDSETWPARYSNFRSTLRQLQDAGVNIVSVLVDFGIGDEAFDRVAQDLAEDNIVTSADHVTADDLPRLRRREFDEGALKRLASWAEPLQPDHIQGKEAPLTTDDQSVTSPIFRSDALAQIAHSE